MCIIRTAGQASVLAVTGVCYERNTLLVTALNVEPHKEQQQQQGSRGAPIYVDP